MGANKGIEGPRGRGVSGRPVRGDFRVRGGSNPCVDVPERVDAHAQRMKQVPSGVELDRSQPVRAQRATFALASDLRSLTAIAKLMGESKATTSRRITRLEGALGVALLRRTPRAVETTDDGVLYRLRIAEVLELMGDANAAIRGARVAPAGQLRVTVPPGFGAVLAPVPARFFQRNFPSSCSSSTSRRAAWTSRRNTLTSR